LVRSPANAPQTTENQERELQAIAERIGWTVVKVYRDQGVSGAKSRQDRPAFDALCKDASRRQFDLIAAWSVDRLGRSLPDLVGFLTEIHALGVNLFLHQQGVDTTTPAGKALFQMMGVFAEFERAMIQERVKAGLQRAKAQGKVLGRPSTLLRPRRFTGGLEGRPATQLAAKGPRPVLNHASHPPAVLTGVPRWALADMFVSYTSSDRAGHQPLCHAALNDALEHMTQQIALTKAAMPVL
jgi:DNA invertase Pin-like site-specific DNA recombinase